MHVCKPASSYHDFGMTSETHRRVDCRASKVPISWTQVIAEPCGDRGTGEDCSGKWDKGRGCYREEVAVGVVGVQEEEEEEEEAVRMNDYLPSERILCV